MTDPREIVERMRALLAKATPGPWAVVPMKGYTDDYVVTLHPDYQGQKNRHYIADFGFSSGQTEQKFSDDAALTIALRNEVPVLLDALSAALDRAERAEKERDEADRRAGSAERRMKDLEESNRKTQLWLDDQKTLRGVDRNVSFDTLWQETCEAADERDRLAADLERAREENTRLRGMLAMSNQPCVYCSLSADDWLKCTSGFPGCARADDANAAEFGDLASGEKANPALEKDKP